MPSPIVYISAGGDRHVSIVMGPDTAPNRNQKFEQLVNQYQRSVLHTIKKVFWKAIQNEPLCAEHPSIIVKGGKAA